MSLQLQFFGATGEVTGSLYALRVGGHTVLLECGLIQGGAQNEERNRDPFPFDLDAVLEACVENSVAVELNAHPSRLDLKDTHLMRAKEKGAKVVISTDAHRVGELDLMSYGVEQARRAWLEPGDVINCWPLKRLLAFVSK